MAFGLARQTGITAEQNQPVMGMQLVFIRHPLFQFIFYGKHSFPRCETGPVGDPEYVCIHRDGGLVEGIVEYHIGGFSADTWQ